jgi:hypothetical protein
MGASGSGAEASEIRDVLLPAAEESLTSESAGALKALMRTNAAASPDVIMELDNGASYERRGEASSQASAFSLSGLPIIGAFFSPPAGKAAEDLVARMVPGPIGYFERKTLESAVSLFGIDAVEALARAGVTINILQVDPYAEVQRNHVAEYLPKKKVINLSPDRVSVSTALHEMGHALDDLLEPDESKDKPLLRSEKDQHLQSLYQNYRDRASQTSWLERLRHDGFFSDYATHSPQEYLAEGIMFYTRSEHSRRILEKADSALYGYIEQLMKSLPAGV